jgi:hypothetical protein
MEKYIIVIVALFVTAGTLSLAYFIAKEMIISAASKKQKRIELPTGVVCVHEKKKDGITHVSVEQNDKELVDTTDILKDITDKYGIDVIEDITTDPTVLYHAKFELSPDQLTNLKNHGKR